MEDGWRMIFHKTIFPRDWSAVAGRDWSAVAGRDWSAVAGRDWLLPAHCLQKNHGQVDGGPLGFGSAAVSTHLIGQAPPRCAQPLRNWTRPLR